MSKAKVLFQAKVVKALATFTYFKKKWHGSGVQDMSKAKALLLFF